MEYKWTLTQVGGGGVSSTETLLFPSSTWSIYLYSSVSESLGLLTSLHSWEVCWRLLSTTWKHGEDTLDDKLTDSEARSVGAVSPPSSSITIAVQRGHVASFAEILTTLLAATHLTDGWYEHHPDPLCNSARAPGDCLSIGWQKRYDDDDDSWQERAESQHVHVVLCSDFLSKLHLLHSWSLPVSIPLVPLSFCVVELKWLHGKKGGKEGRRKTSQCFPFSLFSPKHFSGQARGGGGR